MTAYVARRIDRARKLSGGLSPERMTVAPEVFEELVTWWRRKSSFDALLRHETPQGQEDPPQSVFFDGVEIFPDEDARMPWAVELHELDRYA